jgi:O-acetyl-ADP-ribose deacetylase (regulator of RNase III)
MTLTLVSGNLIEMDVDAIVNAANNQLARGGGVCVAIFEAAGSQELARACARAGRCPTGGAVLTSGFKLKARHIIHTAGPVWRGGREGEPMELRSCYRSSLALAANNKLRSVAFPLISAGIYGYPRLLALEEAMEAISEFFLANLELGGQEPIDVKIVFLGDVSDLADPDLPKGLLKLSGSSEEEGDPGEAEGGNGLGALLGALSEARASGALPRLALASNMRPSRLLEILKEGALERSEALAMSIGLGWGPGLALAVLGALGGASALGPGWPVIGYFLARGGAGINRVNRNLFALRLPALP